MDTTQLMDNPIAIIHRTGSWHYYSAPIDAWVMDWTKWGPTGAHATRNIQPSSLVRGGVEILNEHSADEALAALANNQISEQALREALRSQLPIQDWGQVAHLFPAVLIDFEKLKLTSVYYETLELERFVPNGWTGSFENFYNTVPPEHRYWVDNGVDYLRMCVP